MYMRSNYFKVRDIQEFLIFCKRWQLHSIGEEDERGFLYQSYDGGPFGVEVRDGDTYEIGSEDDIDIPEDEIEGSGETLLTLLPNELSPHLVEGEVAVIMAIDNDRLRSLFGAAWAVNCRGEMQQVVLDDIYEKAAVLGANVTTADF